MNRIDGKLVEVGDVSYVETFNRIEKYRKISTFVISFLIVFSSFVTLGTGLGIFFQAKKLADLHIALKVLIPVGISVAVGGVLGFVLVILSIVFKIKADKNKLGVDLKGIIEVESEERIDDEIEISLIEECVSPLEEYVVSFFKRVFNNCIFLLSDEKGTKESCLLYFEDLKKYCQEESCILRYLLRYRSLIEFLSFIEEDLFNESNSKEEIIRLLLEELSHSIDSYCSFIYLKYRLNSSLKTELVISESIENRLIEFRNKKFEERAKKQEEEKLANTIKHQLSNFECNMDKFLKGDFHRGSLLNQSEKYFDFSDFQIIMNILNGILSNSMFRLDDKNDFIEFFLNDLLEKEFIIRYTLAKNVSIQTYQFGNCEYVIRDNNIRLNQFFDFFKEDGYRVDDYKDLMRYVFGKCDESEVNPTIMQRWDDFFKDDDIDIARDDDLSIDF